MDNTIPVPVLIEKLERFKEWKYKVKIEKNSLVIVREDDVEEIDFSGY